ncbi:AdoMet_MTases domain containing protein [uncultured Caudovirales phage]|uniref:AdoMet_MTases domain containing protein n=1 Tax=uncultured Caudovirales phage TaxID=2100421 RepID=A0A6J5NMB2_9CAUD|nr:AdoMet_MTases domain containing protein [uncultured Caudovirales phage]
MIELKGTKLVEVPYFSEQLTDNSKSVLIIGECQGGIEGISETIHEKGFVNVCTTDIMPSLPEYWLRKNTTWEHIQCDFIEFDESLQFDYIISISVFEHFGFWFAGNRMANGLAEDDTCRWNHDIRGILKSCKLLKDKDSKVIITLPAGPYMNYEESGEPFLRYYDFRRQELIKQELKRNGYYISNERFFLSNDFSNWDEMTPEINDPKYYSVYNIHTPNVIWGLTIQKL